MFAILSDKFETIIHPTEKGKGRSITKKKKKVKLVIEKAVQVQVQKGLSHKWFDGLLKMFEMNVLQSNIYTCVDY